MNVAPRVEAFFFGGGVSRVNVVLILLYMRIKEMLRLGNLTS
jgi:hypothetical protein